MVSPMSFRQAILIHYPLALVAISITTMSGNNTAPNAAPSAQPAITFGIELEGRFLPHPHHHSGSLESFCLEELALLLRSKSGLNVLTDDLSEEVSAHSTWSLTEDGSIMDVESEGLPFELVSRILTCSPQAHAEINTMLTALHAIGKVSVDESCGMHVHVGFGHFGYPLRTVQNLAAIVVGFEPLFATLHPPHRSDTDYARNPSDGFMEPRGGDIANFPSHHSRVAAIMMTTHWNALQDLLGFDRYQAYNFKPAYPTFDSKHTHKTVEFRAATGTFDVEAIIAWANVCTGLVCSASQATEVQLKATFRLLDSPDLNASDLLSKLELSGPAQYYKTRLFDRHENIEPLSPSPRGHVLINAAIDMRPETMADIESTRSLLGHKKIEAAVCEDAENWDYETLPWIPFEEFPYSMSWGQMIYEAHRTIRTRVPDDGSDNDDED